MKRKVAVVAVIIAALSILGGNSLVLYKHSQADPGPLPASLDVTGTNLATLGPIQPAGGGFSVTFDYTPLNHNASVIVLSSDKQMIDYKNDPSGNAGQLTVSGSYSGPIYVMTYGSNWHLTAR